MSINRVTLCGLGKLGLPMAAVFASCGYSVTGYDFNESHVDNIIKGNHGIVEPELNNLLKDYKNSLHFVSEPIKAFRRAEAIFVIVPTPSHEDGYFMNDYIESACKEIGKSLDQQRGYYLIVIVSTVMPGTMEQIKSILEDKSGMKCGKDFGLCYNPEFVALGSVIQNMYQPDSYLIGESDDKAGVTLERFLYSIACNMPSVHRMDFYNAEVSKLCLNAYLTTKISFANSIAGLCEKYPNGDANLVTKFLGADSRIGGKFLKIGTGWGGPCFPRDNIALTYFAKSIGAGCDMQEATVITNIQNNIRIADRICELVEPNSIIAILGVSYKPNTPIVTQSSSLEIARLLTDRGYIVKIHDPQALNNASELMGQSLIYCQDVNLCIENAGLVVLSTPWTEYRKLDLSKHKVFDCWRFLDYKKIPQYYAVGISK